MILDMQFRYKNLDIGRQFDASLTCLYAFLSQIGEGDMSTGTTGAHDLQLAPPGQPVSHAAGTDTVFMTDLMYSPILSVSSFICLQH